MMLLITEKRANYLETEANGDTQMTSNYPSQPPPPGPPAFAKIGKKMSDFYKGWSDKKRHDLESFYKVKNGLSIIMSKSLSKNLSNENKQWCFCCLQDKT